MLDVCKQSVYHMSCFISKLYQLRKLKDQRSKSRDLQDLEERMLLDQIEDNEARVSPRKQRNRMPLSKHRDVRDLQLEVGFFSH